MRRLILAFAFFAATCSGQTTTPNLGLILPATNSTNWGVITNYNMSKLDAAYGAGQIPYQGIWSNTRTYSNGVMVSYLGTLYASTINGNIGNNPSSSGAWIGFPGSMVFPPAGLGKSNGSAWITFSPTHCSGGQVPTGIDANGNAFGCFTPAGSGSGIQYDTAAAYAWFSDSLLMVSTTDANSTLKLSSTVTAGACDGTSSATSCFITDATGVGASFYHLGQWLMPGADTLLGFSPACLAYSRVQITQITGNNIYFSEPQTIIPTRTGCTGVQSGTGGTVQDASNFSPQQMSYMPYFNHGGISPPPIDNWSWPGQTIVDLATNMAAKMTGLPTGSYVFVQSEDYCGTNNSATFIGYLQTIATAIHAAGHKAFVSSTPVGPTFNCGLGVTGDATAALVNEWIQQNAQCPASTSATNCYDGVIDQASFGVNSRFDVKLVNQTGTLAGHETDLGNAKTAEVYHQALVNKFTNNTGGLLTAGGGTLRGMVNASAYSNTQPAGFGVGPWAVYDSGNGFTIWSSMGVMYAGNRFVYQPTASFCWNYDNTAPLNNQCDESGLSRSQYGNGVAVSGFSDAGHGNGSLDFSTWRPAGLTSTPTFVVDGQMYYRSDLHQPCYNNNGTALCGWGASATLQGTSPVTVNGDNLPHTGTSFTVACSGCSGSGIPNTTITTSTTLITANTCVAGPGSPVTMTGVASTSVFDITPNADVSGVNGWGNFGGLVIVPWPTANAFNYKVCNQTGGSITPGASVTWNVGAR